MLDKHDWIYMGSDQVVGKEASWEVALAQAKPFIWCLFGYNLSGFLLKVC